MIKVENLSYGFIDSELYEDISFEIERDSHVAFIGSNGTGKTTLIDLLLDEDDRFLYKGKIIKEEPLHCGYVSQVAKADVEEGTVFDFLAKDFVENQKKNELLCEKMATEEDLEPIFEEYQKVLDEFQAMDGDHYESNIRKQLALAGLSKIEELELSKISGGEYKLVQIIRQMLRKPDFLVMDEPDVFLDFHNLTGLRDLIQSYKGTFLVITHNRYLLNHCFNKILHLENRDIQEFDGTYMEYRYELLLKKIEMQEQSNKDEEEIERTKKMVDRLRLDATRVDNATKGRALKAKVTQLERLEKRKIKAPFVEIRYPNITLPILAENEVIEEQEQNEKVVLSVSGYELAFGEQLLEDVHFEIHEGEKVALVGPNGTGKTTLFHELFEGKNSAFTFSDDVQIGFLSQMYGDTLKEENTISQEMEESQIKSLEDYCFKEEDLSKKVSVLSGGEKNLLQLAKIANSNANFLLLDEPTSHLDTYSQLALEHAIEDYKGTILMVSHDFYSIANMDYVLYVEDKTIRRMRMRSFRKMIYENHFNQEYLELEAKKKQLEQKMESFLEQRDVASAQKLTDQLGEYIDQMQKMDS